MKHIQQHPLRAYMYWFVMLIQLGGHLKRYPVTPSRWEPARRSIAAVGLSPRIKADQRLRHHVEGDFSGFPMEIHLPTLTPIAGTLIEDPLHDQYAPAHVDASEGAVHNAPIVPMIRLVHVQQPPVNNGNKRPRYTDRMAKAIPLLVQGTLQIDQLVAERFMHAGDARLGRQSHAPTPCGHGSRAVRLR